MHMRHTFYLFMKFGGPPNWFEQIQFASVWQFDMDPIKSSHILLL